MAIFHKTVTQAIALDHSLDREPMALNFSIESGLELTHSGGRLHDKNVESELALSQDMYRTHAESVMSVLVLTDAAIGINSGRTIEHVLSLESEVVRNASEFGRIVEMTISLQQFVAVVKLPLIENGSYV